MKMMNRLFDLVGKTWNRAPKDVPVLTVRRGDGVHTRFTIDRGQLHFHTLGYHPKLPLKQTVVLDELTLPDLEGAIRRLGYEVEPAPGFAARGLNKRQAYTLMPALNQPLDGAVLTTFESKLWELLYPIARLLEEAEGDIDSAVKQMLADTTRGDWLDYWAGFFSVYRVKGESDSGLSTRMFTSINSLKTSNLAIAEVLRGALLEDAFVRDVAPATFEVELLPAFISQKQLTDALIHTVKGAGIDFYYHYRDKAEEHYPAYLQDKIGKPATQAEGVDAGLTYVEAGFGWGNAAGFQLNGSLLNSQERLAPVYKLREGGSMTLTQGTTTVQSMTW